MNNKSRLAAMALVAAVGVATPAAVFAANRVQHYGSSPSQLGRYGRNADRANGLGAYASVPGSAVTTSDPVNNPVTSGGGSMGYNKYMGHAH